MALLENILSFYGINSPTSIEAFGTGLINSTWKINDGSRRYILQKINHAVFPDPTAIAYNIDSIATYLKDHAPTYFFIPPIHTMDGRNMVQVIGEGYFRLFPFVEKSSTHDVVAKPEQAFEAAAQFGSFTHVLGKFPAEVLKITIQHFHDLPFRFKEFTQAWEQGNPLRIRESESLIRVLKEHQDIVSSYEKLTRSKAFKSRVTHHDTKISNVLFDEKDKGLAVIDLDTVMPGYFISDVGDMMRTYLSPVSEEEKDFSKIGIREDFFQAIAEGYLGKMGGQLSEEEMMHFVYSGLFMSYMQALRFLTDHLNNDRYYGAAYEGQNFTRAGNQVVLFQRILEKQQLLNQMVKRNIANQGIYIPLCR
ncbi:MAG: phosphotransferase enzyme family protein [Flavisolibacter sp.]